jgi:hypothetical protein
MRRIALINPDGQFDTVPCLVSTAKMLARSGYEVHIFIISDDTYLVPYLPETEVHVLQPPKSNKRRDRWTHLITKWLPFLMKNIKRNNCDLIIGVNPLGILLATAVGVAQRIPTVYYSLELLIREEIISWRQRIFKVFEIFCTQRAKLSIIQDKKRADILSKENRIERDQIVLLPNSYLGPAYNRKTNYLRERLEIPEEKRIILHIGSIAEINQSIHLAQIGHTWKEDFVLVFHTRRKLRNNVYKRRFLHFIDNNRVYLLEAPIPHFELDNLVSSADAGIALYEINPNKKNIYYMGLSSGKIAQYLKCGLPVIVSNLPLINTMVSQYHCGICVKNFNQIWGGIRKIWTDYQLFRNGAIRCFEENIRFEHYFPELLTKIRIIQS